MYKKILVPIDGSNSSHDSLRHALQLARIHGSTVEIIHVMTFSEKLPQEPKESRKSDTPSAWIEDYMAKIRVKSEEMLNEAVEESKTTGLSCEVTSKLLAGKPGDAILQESSLGGFDLIVIGSRGLGGLKELVLGSVSHQVVSESKIPVLVVK